MANTFYNALACAKRALAASLFVGAALASNEALALTAGQPASLSAGPATTAPIGWVQFCRDTPAECRDNKNPAVSEVKLTRQAWADMVRINNRVNDAVEPISDMDHYGVIEFWSYPIDGKGDCEDYVLLKRKELMEAGFPRSALLITVVRQSNGEGHAVLTVKTDRGDYILDNQAEEVMLWHETGYRFVKRQAETNQNQWVSLGTGASPAYTARQ